jgi:hypothetical protein
MNLEDWKSRRFHWCDSFLCRNSDILGFEQKTSGHERRRECRWRAALRLRGPRQQRGVSLTFDYGSKQALFSLWTRVVALFNFVSLFCCAVRVWVELKACKSSCRSQNIFFLAFSNLRWMKLSYWRILHLFRAVVWNCHKNSVCNCKLPNWSTGWTSDTKTDYKCDV